MALKFYTGTEKEFLAEDSKNPDGIYFISDTKSIYKGNVKYDNGIGLATYSIAGLVKPKSTDFDVAGDGTLSLYIKPAINSFTLSKTGDWLGNSVPSLTVSWSVNKIPSALTVTVNNETFSLPKTLTGSQQITLKTPLTATRTFTLSMTDNKNSTATKTANLTFYPCLYVDVSNITDSTKIFSSVVGASTGQRHMKLSRGGTYTITAAADQYIYITMPTSFGEPTFFVGGFEGGFSKVLTGQYAMWTGYKTDYNVYRSTNKGLGKTTIEVK